MEYARKYKKELTFIGGLDAQLLTDGSKSEILAECKRIMDGMREIGAAFIFGSDHSIPPGVSLENYKMVLDYFNANCN